MSSLRELSSVSLLSGRFSSELRSVKYQRKLPRFRSRGTAESRMFHPNIPKIKLGTLNVRRLSTTGRLLELQKDLEGINIDVLALTELRWKGMGALDLNDSEFRLLHAGPEDRLETSGTGFLLSRRLQPFFHGFRRIGPRISRMDLKFDNQLLCCFSVYAPPTRSGSDDDDEEDEFEALLEELRDELRTARMSGWERGVRSSGSGEISWMRVTPVLLGDFNAKMGSREEQEEALGNFGHGIRNQRGQLLTDLCEDFNLRSVNSFYKARPGRKWTWNSPDGRTKNCIDYILAPKSLYFRSSSVLGKTIAGSDHRMLRAVLQSPTSTIRREQSQPKNRCRLNRDLYRMAIAANAPPEVQSPNGYANIVSYIQEAAKFAEEPVEKNSRLSSNTINLLRQRHEMRRNRNTLADRIAFTELNKLVRREVQKDITNHHCQLVEAAIEKSKGLRKVRGEVASGRRRIVQLRDDQGICSTTTEIHNAVKKFYEDLYASTVHVEHEAVDSTDACPEFLETELEEALKKMKCGRSPGTDKVTVEMLKLGKSNLLRPLTDVFNWCLRCCEIPEKMADASTILLFKKGDPLLIKNYRPISLLSVIYKLLTKVINQRIESVLDTAQPAEQAGFRKKFSTTDHLHAVNELLEKTREYRLPIFIAFIDYEKAFDSVETNAVWNAIQRQGVPSQLVALLRKIYKEASSHIQLGEGRVPIEIQRGVRQGDTISPKLFTAVLEEIFRTLEWEELGMNINGHQLTNLRFADDIALIATSEEELQRMVNELNEESLRSGLKINIGKTKILASEETSILLNGQELEQVESFIYLGQEVRIKRDHAKEISRRVRSGWNVFRQYRDFMTSRMVQMKWKRKLFNQCVLPAMLYGSETWALTKSARTKLATTQRRMERRMVGVRLLDRKTNEWLRGITKLKDINEAATRRKWTYAWKLANSNGTWQQKITEWRPPTTRPIGRPRTRWRDELVKNIGSQQWQQRARRTSMIEWIRLGVA